MKKFVLFAILALSACAHSPADLQPDLMAADKKCVLKAGQAWPNEVTKTNCYDAVDREVIKRDAPVILEPYEALSQKAKLLAQKFDDENAPVREANQKYKQGLDEDIAVLRAHEPRWNNKDATLCKEIIAVSPLTVCAPQATKVGYMECFDTITRPIWERDAPDTIEYYSEYQKKWAQLAKDYDAVGVQKIYAAADKNLQASIKEAASEFWAAARQAIQKQQAADAQSAAENAAATAQILNAIGELVQGFAQGAAMAEQARANATPPTQTVVVQQQPQTTHTNCQWSSLFHQMQCTTTPY